MGQESGIGNRTVRLLATGAAVRIADDNVGEVITIHAVGCPSSSRVGDSDEAAFVARACEFDFRVARPWGNIDPYDVLVGMGRGFWRVQVKRATRRHGGQYQAMSRSRSRLYTKDTIDFIAAHLVQENIWYIVPIEAIGGRMTVNFNPHSRRKSEYEKYREAWCLLACEPKARGWKDIPVVCRCKEVSVRCAVCPNR